VHAFLSVFITLHALFYQLTALNSSIYNSFCVVKETLFINELMSSNTSTLRDGDIDDLSFGNQGGAYSDWIEIYNAGSQAVSLKGYTLYDSSAAWTFPDAIVPAGGFLLVWASDKNKVAKDGQVHTNFKLSSSGETVILNKPDGTEVDSVNLVSLGSDQSFGRSTDGSAEFSLFSKATPGTENTLGQIMMETPVFSHKAGFYTEAFDLTLSANQFGAKIYYTKDGSDPVPGIPFASMDLMHPLLPSSTALFSEHQASKLLGCHRLLSSPELCRFQQHKLLAGQLFPRCFPVL